MSGKEWETACARLNRVALILMASVGAACGYDIEGSWRTVGAPITCEDGTASDIEFDVRDCADSNEYYDVGPSCEGSGRLCGCEFQVGGWGGAAINPADDGAYVRLADCGLETYTYGPGYTSDGGHLNLFCVIHDDSMECEQVDSSCEQVDSSLYNTNMLPCGAGLSFDRR